MYGKKTGATLMDARKEAFALEPTQYMGVTHEVPLPSELRRQADYRYAQDGISNTFSIVPKSLGSDREEQLENLTSL